MHITYQEFAHTMMYMYMYIHSCLYTQDQGRIQGGFDPPLKTDISGADSYYDHVVARNLIGQFQPRMHSCKRDRPTKLNKGLHKIVATLYIVLQVKIMS